VDLINFSEPDEEIQEDIDIEDVNELPEQGESIGLEHLSNVNVETIVPFLCPLTYITTTTVSWHICKDTLPIKRLRYTMLTFSWSSN
jgi:hypothetical protein